MKLCSLSKCTGCLACVNICPRKALLKGENNEGFYEPIFLQEKCIDCGLCTKSCPVLNEIRKDKITQYGYAVWSKNSEIRKKSSSGGAFSELASLVLKRGGIVFGAAFDSRFSLYHMHIYKIEELPKLRGSKYLQSDINDSYEMTKYFLKEGREVLFSGTPCQVAGLYGYLQKDYEKLITCDFVCHGVPSPKVFFKYKEWLEKVYNSSLLHYSFRDKRKSWHWFNTKAVFSSGDVYIGTWFKDPFMRLFLRDNILQKACYQCKYTNMDRMGDITIADYWGYKAFSKREKDTDEGISMLLVNTIKGEKIVNSIKDSTIFFERSFDEISKSQKSLSAPWEEPKTRSDFWDCFFKEEFDIIIERWAYPERRNLSQYLVSEYGAMPVVKAVCFFYSKILGLQRRLFNLCNTKYD